MIHSKVKNKFSSFFNKLKRNKNRSIKESKRQENIVPAFKITQNKAIIFAFVFLVFGLLYYLIPIIINVIRFDFTKAEGDTKLVSEIGYSSKINIIVIGVDEYNEEYKFIDGLALLSYDYSNKELGMFSINPDLRVNIANVNKSVEIRRLLNNSAIKGQEIDYLISTLESLFAIKIDRYIYINIQGFNEITNTLPSMQLKLTNDVNDSDTVALPIHKSISYESGQNDIKGEEILALFASDANGKNDQLNRQVNIILGLIKNIKNYKTVFNFNDVYMSVIKNIRTNMSKIELGRLFYEFSSIRDDQIKKGYIRTSSYYAYPTTNIYGSYIPIIERVDKDISSIFFSLEVFKEHARIEIFNASGVRGLASNRYRWIMNLGGNVVKVGNAEEEVDEVYVYCEEVEKYQNTINEMKKIFSGEVIIKKEKYYNRQIGDIVVIIGKKYR